MFQSYFYLNLERVSFKKSHQPKFIFHQSQFYNL